MADVEHATVGKRERPPWRFLLTGISLGMLPFAGVIDAVSITSRHGYEWHKTIKAFVDAYRDKFYQFHEVIFGPLFRLFGWHLSDAMKDGLTIAMLVVSAIAAESSLRDDRTLFYNLYLAVRTFFRKERATEYSGFLDGALRHRERIGGVSVILTLISFLTIVTLLIINVSVIVGLLPHWLKIFAFDFFVYGSAFSVVLLILLFTDRLWPIFEPPIHLLEIVWLRLLRKKFELESLIMIAAFPIITALWLSRLFLRLFMFLLFAFPTGLVLLIAPFLAWRMVAIAVLSFLALLGVNWLALHHVI